MVKATTRKNRIQSGEFNFRHFTFVCHEQELCGYFRHELRLSISVYRLTFIDNVSESDSVLQMDRLQDLSAIFMLIHVSSDTLLYIHPPNLTQNALH